MQTFTETTDTAAPVHNRYAEALPPRGSTNQHGQIEMLGDVPATHWFTEAGGVTWHFVTTGDPQNEPLLIVHGLPESWYAFHNQMRDLADQFYCIGVDMLGNGQSDKRLDIDYSYASLARYLAAFIDEIGLETCNIAGHDRGTVVCDHLLNVGNMNKRVLRYVRMQQSADQPHGSPRPPHRLFASSLSVLVGKHLNTTRWLYRRSPYAVPGIEDAVLDRLCAEFAFPGIAEAFPLPFRTTSFDKELADREEYLFAKMTMPVLFLQGRNDPGQHPEEYEHTAEAVANGRVQFIDANHFFHLEKPEDTTVAFRAFLSEPLPESG